MEIQYSQELGAFKKIFYIPNSNCYVDMDEYIQYVSCDIPKMQYYLGFDLNKNRYAICVVGSFTSIMIFYNVMKRLGFRIENE